MSERVAKLGGEPDSPPAGSSAYGEWIPWTSNKRSWWLEIVDRAEDRLLVRLCIPDVPPEQWEVLEGTPLPGGGLMLTSFPRGRHDPR